MESTTGTTRSPETHSFQAETQQLLHIVIHSLYTDREIFLRELISNAADALERIRHEILVNPDLPEKDTELRIDIRSDEEKKQVVLTDTGTGMTRDELSENLGTIARSGTKEFLTRAAEAAKSGDLNLIGQFGVGFYSAFMVARKVIVETRSFHADSEGWRWESEGEGQYTISPAEGLPRGTRITLELKEDAGEFAKEWRLKEIVRKFSNFVPFPIEINGTRVNTVQAIWARNRSEITDQEYTEFFRFISTAMDDPRYRLHFTADAPLAIQALLYVPKDNFERLGFGRMEPGVDLYCRRVLIQKHPEKLLPEWMRFVRGVVDSDDLPLNISRETMQDSALIRKLSKVITGRFLKFLAEEANRDAEAYGDFFETFGRFLKEGIVEDPNHRDDLAKLLRFETSRTEKGKTTSLADYLTRMKPEQKDIYFVNGPSREAIEAGPYVEGLLSRGIEVIYNYEPIDDFVFDHLGEFEEKKFVSADRGDIELPEGEDKGELEPLDKEKADALSGWMKKHLGERVGSVRTSKRLVRNPAAIVTDSAMTATMQRLMMSVNREGAVPGAGLTLELNTRHPLVHRLAELSTADETLAREVTDQLVDNALLGAGLLMDPRGMVERLNTLLTRAAGK